jgi:hypothetical protein
MDVIAIIAVMATGGLGLGLMLAAFVLIAGRGGWQEALQPDAQGRWPLPRKLLAAGAGLGCLFGAIMFLPGVVPWWHYSWGHGVVFGFFLGVVFCLLTVQLIRHRGQNQGPKA